MNWPGFLATSDQKNSPLDYSTSRVSLKAGDIAPYFEWPPGQCGQLYLAMMADRAVLALAFIAKSSCLSALKHDRSGRSNAAWRGTSPAFTFVDGAPYGTKKAQLLCGSEEVAPQSPPMPVKIVLLMAAKAAVRTTAAASNEVAAVVDARVDSGAQLGM